MTDSILHNLIHLLSQHKDKRVIVVGTTCCGKSTLVAQIPLARDQDQEVFAHMSQQESDYVCQTPWTPEIGRAMTKFVRKYVQSAIGAPVFGTVVIPCDLIIFLKISPELLSKRCAQRQASLQDALNMQAQIRHEAVTSGSVLIEFYLG